MLSTTVVPSAQAEVDLVKLFDAHDKMHDDFFTVTAYTSSGRTEQIKYYGCPADLPILPRNVTNGESIARTIEQARNNCKQSVQNLIMAVEREPWSVAMEAITSRTILTESHRTLYKDNWTHTRKNIAYDIILGKRREYLLSLRERKWSEQLEKDALVFKPHRHWQLPEIHDILQKPRHTELEKQAGSDKWSPEWERNLRSKAIARYHSYQTNELIKRRFKQFMVELDIDGTPWSVDLENRVQQAMVGARPERQKYVSDILENKRTWLAKAFENDGEPWSLTWDNEIAPLASYSGYAYNVQVKRREEFVREVTSQQPWSKAMDRQLEAFVKDSVAQRVILSDQTIAAIQSWRGVENTYPGNNPSHSGNTPSPGNNPSHPGNTPSGPGNTSWSFENLSSTAGIEKVFGIILALLTGIGAVLSALLPLAKRILPIIQRR